MKRDETREPFPGAANSRAAESSAVVRAVQRAATDSVVYAAAAVILRACRGLQEWSAVGVGRGWSTARERRMAATIDGVVADSRIFSGLRRLVAAPLVASETASTRRLLAPFLELDALSRVGAVGWVVIVAVATHITTLALLRVPVYALGWTVRGGLVAAGILLACSPRMLAMVWKDRTDTRWSN